MTESNQSLIFDRALLRRHRARAAPTFSRHRVLADEAGRSLVERLYDVKGDFASVLLFGTPDEGLLEYFKRDQNRLVVEADVSDELIRRLPKMSGSPSVSLLCDEDLLPFAPHSFDAIVGRLTLHWVNDLPGALVQMRQALKPGGLFHAVLLGGSTLFELRACLLDAELAVTGGVSPRLSPSIDLMGATALLQRGGFVSPIADHETLTFTYPDLFSLMRDLRGMGESNLHLHRLRKPTRRAVFREAERLYRARFAGLDGALPATFELLFLHGWKDAGSLHKL